MTHTSPAARHAVNPCTPVPWAPGIQGSWPWCLWAKGQGAMVACRTTPQDTSLPTRAPRSPCHLPPLLLVSFKNESIWPPHLDSRGDQREQGGLGGECGNGLQLAKEWGKGPLLPEGPLEDRVLPAGSESWVGGCDFGFHVPSLVPVSSKSALARGPPPTLGGALCRHWRGRQAIWTSLPLPWPLPESRGPWKGWRVRWRGAPSGAASCSATLEGSRDTPPWVPCYSMGASYTGRAWCALGLRPRLATLGRSERD